MVDAWSLLFFFCGVWPAQFVSFAKAWSMRGAANKLNMAHEVSIEKKNIPAGSIGMSSTMEDTTTTTTSRMFANRQYLPVEYYGIWDRSNKYDKTQRPFVKGWVTKMKWSQFEPEEGKFDFSYIDTALSRAHSQNGSFYAMVAVGPSSPTWIYNKTVKVDVKPDPKHPGFKKGYPYYLDPGYNSLRNTMFNAFGNYVRNHAYSTSIGFVQATFGCTGDAVLYKTQPVEPKYRMSYNETMGHMFDSWRAYKSAFQEGPGRVIPILINSMDDEDPLQLNFALETFVGLGMKGSAYVRGHHLDGERSFVLAHRAQLLNATSSSPYPFLFSRAEHDQTWKKPFFQINVPLGFHWAIITGLNQGLGVHDVAKDAMAACYKLGFADSFEFFSLYAPHIWPHNATNAFIALHEGLDAGDLDKFPAGDEFGPAGRGLDRIARICAAYADFGCSNDDPVSALTDQVYQRAYQTGYNDVGYDIWRTNYGRWIEQIDADATSQGLFRIGGVITSSSSKYARFARGLVHRLNKTGMYFRFSDGFFGDSAPGVLSFHLIWFDNASGSFQINYTDLEQREVVALDEVCVGDKQWKHAYFSIDSLSSRRHVRGSDFSIVSKNSTDVIVHMIEVSRTL